MDDVTAEDSKLQWSNNGISAVAVDLLKVLKQRYNYRKLSDLTGIPVSTLTRYITGKTAPKGAKAQRLLKDLIVNLNITSILSEFREGDGGLIISRVMLNPNMVKILGAHIINEFAGTRITSFMSLDILSIPLTSYLSIVTSRQFYIVSREPLPVKDGEQFTIFLNHSGNAWPTSFWVYFSRPKRREEVLMISSRAPEEEFFNTLVRRMEQENAEIIGLFSVIGSDEKLSKLKLKPGSRKLYLIQE